MLLKKIITITTLSLAIASLQAMEAPASKYEKAKEYLKAYFNEKMASCPLEQAEIIGFGGDHNRSEHYAQIVQAVNTLADQQSVLLIEGLEKGKFLDKTKTKNWAQINDSITIKGCDDTAQNIKGHFETIGKKVAQMIADIRQGKSIDPNTILPSDQDLIVKRNKIYMAAILEELNSGNKVCIYFGPEHFDKDPEAKELRDFLASKKSCVYFAQDQAKPEEQAIEETREYLSWLKPYIEQNNTTPNSLQSQNP